MKIKKFFFWVSWHSERNCEKATVCSYVVMIVFGGILYSIMRLVGTNFQDALKISIIASVSVVVIIGFIASVFFSKS